MHSKIMRFMVDFSLVVGVILSIFIAILVNGVADNGGLAFFAFFVSLIIIEVGLAGEGMKVEQAENIAKIAYNTEQLLNMQQKGNTTSGVQQSQNVIQPREIKSSISYKQSNPTQISSTKWTCKKCLEKNAGEHQFCMNCGDKKPYF